MVEIAPVGDLLALSDALAELGFVPGESLRAKPIPPELPRAEPRH